MFPAAGAKDICPDTPLRVAFDGAPTAGTGKVQIFDAANEDTLIAWLRTWVTRMDPSRGNGRLRFFRPDGGKSASRSPAGGS